MFDVGFWEVSLIFVVALLVVGPEKLPGLARTVGLYVGKARRYAEHVRREIDREVHSAEIKELEKETKALGNVKNTIDNSLDSLNSEVIDEARPLQSSDSSTNITNEAETKIESSDRKQS